MDMTQLGVIGVLGVVFLAILGAAGIADLVEKRRGRGPGRALVNKKALSSLPAERLIGEYLRYLAREWWAAQPESRTVATCDACSGQPVPRNEGRLVGSSLWCEDCYSGQDVEGQLRRDPNAAGYGILQKAQQWAAGAR